MVAGTETERSSDSETVMTGGLSGLVGFGAWAMGLRLAGRCWCSDETVLI